MTNIKYLSRDSFFFIYIVYDNSQAGDDISLSSLPRPTWFTLPFSGVPDDGEPERPGDSPDVDSWRLHGHTARWTIIPPGRPRARAHTWRKIN